MTKKQYIKPRALNLSGLAVIGYEPLGFCGSGWDPSVADCPGGEGVTQEEVACYPQGFNPTEGDCGGGGHVSTGCGNGSAP